MSNSYFEPWTGENYDTTKLLIVSESAYDWRDRDNGQQMTPAPSHPTTTVRWSTDPSIKLPYFACMNRALCRTEKPSPAQIREAWKDYAYTIYVQSTVGLGAGKRPRPEQFREANCCFLSLIEKLRPRKVIITGKAMWSKMPPSAVWFIDDLQAYKLEDGDLVWCLALPHPANRREGFNWKHVAEQIRVFKSMELPRRD